MNDNVNDHDEFLHLIVNRLTNRSITETLDASRRDSGLPLLHIACQLSEIAIALREQTALYRRMEQVLTGVVAARPPADWELD